MSLFNECEKPKFVKKSNFRDVVDYKMKYFDLLKLKE